MPERKWPVIYVRGYAMREADRDETAADPFCGFNVGSTLYRSDIDKNLGPKKFIFQSPLVRLASEFGYRDVYVNGVDILDPDWTPPADQKGIPKSSVIIYRYYDSGSSFFGDDKKRKIEDYAGGLSELILKVKDLVCQGSQDLRQEDFRCYLVAHSMGGLIVRAFLQNPGLGAADARKAVDKVFTYATPHNGIDMAGINVPSWLSINDTDTFNRERMAQYLALQGIYREKGRVDYLPERLFPTDRFFCMVGTDRMDYEALKGLSRAFVGHGSDGLVKIENASVWGIDGSHQITKSAPAAYAYRSHSGFYGIVNSEEAYQNLVRFLFGDIRVDIFIDVENVTLPPELKDKAVEALYQFELLAGPRGKRWYLTRRVAEEDSPACRTHAQLTDDADHSHRSIYMSTVFLAKSARVDPGRPSLAYAMTVGIRTPDYQENGKFWADKHYEGTYLFHDSVIVEIIPPDLQENGQWSVTWSWYKSRDSAKVNLDGGLTLLIPFGSDTPPGVTGKLRLAGTTWNTAGNIE